MRRTIRLKPMLTLLLALVMVLGLLPAPVHALPSMSSMWNRKEPYLACRVKVSTATSSGTNSDVYCDVNYQDGSSYSFKMDKGSYDDFESGDNDTYWFSIKKPVWMIKSYAVRIDGSDGLCIKEVEIAYAADANSAQFGAVKESYSGNGHWLDSKGEKVTLTPSLKRKLTDSSYSTFTSAFNGTAYLDAGASSSNTNVTWSPTCDSDGLWSNSYNPYDFADSPTFSYSAEAAVQGSTSWSAINLSNQILWDHTTNDVKDGFTYKPSALYNTMVSSNYYGLRIKVTLSYPTRSSQGTTSKTVYYTFYRKQFQVGDAQIKSSYFTAADQQYYFNQQYSQIKLYIPVQANINYTKSDVASGVSASTIRLYYGNGSNDYLTGTISDRDSNGFYVTFDGNSKSYNSTGSDGFKLLLQGVTARVNGQTYNLYDIQSFSGANGTTVASQNLGGSNVSLGYGAYFRSLLMYKLDNVPPTVSLQEVGASGDGQVTGQWKKQINVITRAAENIYLTTCTNPNDGPHLAMSVTNGSSPLEVQFNGGSSKSSSYIFGSMTGSDVETSFKLPDSVNAEYGDIRVSVTGRDYAGNPVTKTISGLKLDTLAPRVTVGEETPSRDIGGNLIKSYTFNIEDASGTGRVNYCFVRDGKPLPSETEGLEHSGVIEDLYEQWAFVSQDSTSRTVVLKLAQNETFTGFLYYYSVDGLGNRTQWSSKRIILNNRDAACEYQIYVQGTDQLYSNDYPRPGYRIVFTPDADCTVFYRLAPETAWTEYTSPFNVEGRNGTQTLEYKVVNDSASVTTEAYFTGDNGITLVFDNAIPQLNLTRTSSGYSLAAQTFTLGATDPSGILSAGYEVLRADTEAVVKTGTLTLTEGSGVLLTTLSTADIQGLGNGRYKLRLTAADRNGQTASATSDAFSIRVTAPTVTVTAVNGAVPGDPTITGGADNSITLSVADAFTAVSGTHNVYYRVSGDGSTYSDWFKLSALDKGTDRLSAEGTLTTLPSLNEGTNSVFIQVFCAESDKNTTTETISAVTTLEPVSILLDTTKPAFTWTVTCIRNNTALTGEIQVSDGVTPYPAVTVVTPGVELTRDTGNRNLYRLVYDIPESKAIPDEIVVTAADEAGNVQTLTIAEDLALLDVTGPVITVGDPVYTNLGDRVDAQITVRVQEDHPGPVDFQYSTEAGRYAVTTDNGDGTWTVLLRGYTASGASPFTVTADDDLGNRTTADAPAAAVVYPELALTGLFAQPTYARESAPVGLQFNIPAAAVPIYVTQNEGETLEQAADRAFTAAERQLNTLTASGLSTAPGCVLRHSIYSVTEDAVAYELAQEFGSGWQGSLTAVGGGAWSCYVMAMDEFGNVKYYVVYPDTLFDMEFPIDFTLRQYYDGVVVATLPDNGIIVGEHAPDPSVDPEGTPVKRYTAQVVVSAGAMPGSDAYVFPYAILTEGDARITGPSAEDGDDKGTLFRFDRSSADTVEVTGTPYGWAFTQAAFVADTGTGANAVSSGLNVGYVNHPGDAAGGESQTVYVRMFAPDSAYAAALDPADIWLNESIQLGAVISAQPEITHSWRQNSIAAEVQLDVSAQSGGTEMQLIKVLQKTATGWTVVGQWNRGDSDGPNLSLTLTEEGTYCVYAENEYGLSTLSQEFAVTIVTDPITEEHFSILEEAYDYGWATVTDDTLPATEARFTVTITAEGAARGVKTADPESGVVTLTAEAPTYTLVLTDDFGYQYTKTLTYAGLIQPPAPDVTAPAVEYTFTNENKTNKPYDVIVTASDGESGIRSVTLTLGSETIPLTEGPATWNGTAEESGTWTGTVSVNGSYMLSVEDRAGNVVKKVVSVMNIDASPVTAQLAYSTRETTQDIVTVTLSFNKHNVTITKLERNSGSGYISMDKNERKVFFPGNGTVTVYFVDEYGNEGFSLVTVTNIYEEPPRLKAVPELAEDGLSVTVTFEMEKDENGAPLDTFRRLKDLTVIQNGVSYSADQAKYVLRDNGVYSFTVVDKAGLMQVIEVKLKDIDRDAPQVKSVSWSYTYVDSEGNERNAVYSLDDITGAGYRIAIDKYIRTNRDVTVTVVTDKPTAIIGAYGETPALSHELVYHENGMYIYNLIKNNGLSVSYGVDVEIIDKTPPELELEGPNYYLFVEGRDTGSIRDMLMDYSARDVYLTRTTDLTGAVTVDFGGLDPDTLENNTFDKSKPFTVRYSVKDDAGNETVVTRTVVLVGINDVLVTVNGVLPNAASMSEIETGEAELKLINFSGAAYATWAPGMRTFGQMKTVGEVLTQQNGAFSLKGLQRGWYTVFIQTETRDYFNIYLYVNINE